MLLRFYCPNKDCRNKDSKPYFLNISSAALYDNEIGELFCPRCKRKLMRQIRIGDPKSYGDSIKRSLVAQMLNTMVSQVI
jgi:hypothetical protein